MHDLIVHNSGPGDDFAARGVPPAQGNILMLHDAIDRSNVS